MAHPTVDRLRAVGPMAASPVDLVAVGFSRREADVSDDMGRVLLKKWGRIQSLLEASPQDLREQTGLDDFELLRAMALVELGRRAGGAGRGFRDEVLSAEDVFHLFEYLTAERREHFCAALLDSKGFLLKASTIHIGTLTSSMVGAREVFREAIREGASSLIVVHNHPSGDPTPSPEDLEVTDRLVEIGKMLDIPVLDHVIIGEKRYTSLRGRGLMG